MKIHEFQAKDLLRAAGVPVLAGKVARTPEEAAAAFTALGTPVCAVKAQIHAGGRGKGSVIGSSQRGVELAKSAADAARIAQGLLGQTLVTIQTGPEGQVVRQVFVESGCQIERELYCAVLVDRRVGSPVLIASTAGGVDIEEVAAHTPELILSEPFDPDRGLAAYQTRVLAAKLGLPHTSWRAAEQFFRSLTKAFVALDASLLEINPRPASRQGLLRCLPPGQAARCQHLPRLWPLAARRVQPRADHPEFCRRRCRHRAGATASPRSGHPRSGC